MKQSDLFVPRVDGSGPPRLTAPFVEASATSKAAAESLSSSHLNRLEAMVFDVIAKSEATGCTDDELEVALKMPHQTVSARRRTLVTRAKVVNSGMLRPTRHGRQAVVWILGDRGPVIPGTSPSRPGRPSNMALRAAADLLERSHGTAVGGNIDSEMAGVAAWLRHLVRR